jgi:hypothetical protein
MAIRPPDGHNKATSTDSTRPPGGLCDGFFNSDICSWIRSEHIQKAPLNAQSQAAGSTLTFLAPLSGLRPVFDQKTLNRHANRKFPEDFFTPDYSAEDERFSARANFSEPLSYGRKTKLYRVFPDGSLVAGFGTMNNARIQQSRNLRCNLSIKYDSAEAFDFHSDQMFTSEVSNFQRANFPLSNPLIAELF